jgi:hypothetical protein
MMADPGSSDGWSVSGTYLEACNCEAICPCRRIAGKQGGRSTFGICMGSLCWQIQEGSAGEADLTGLRVVMALRYSDDEPGSPWTYVLYVDERGDAGQRQALEDIWTGRRGGTALSQFPWVWKPSDLVAVRAVEIELDHTAGRGWFRATGHVTVHVREPVADQETVTCVIPGHHQSGREVVADTLSVQDGPLEFAFSGRCGYEAPFAYSSDA